MITPTLAASSFPVVIATQKDGKPRFYVNSYALNQRMRADRSCLLKNQEMVVVVTGGVSFTLFTTLEVFPSDWKIELDK